MGHHPAALVTAVAASRLGFSTLVLPLGPTMGFFISKTGQCFDPESNYLLRSSSFSKTVNKSVDPQILTPSFYLHWSTFNQALALEFKREFGEFISDKLRLISVLELIEKKIVSPFRQNFYELFYLESVFLDELKKTLKKELKKSELSGLDWISKTKSISDLERSIHFYGLDELFAGLFYFVSSNTCNNPSLFQVLRVLILSKLGVSFKGGLTAYREHLFGLARKSGANILQDVKLNRIFVEKNKFVGIQVTDKGNMITAHAGILGSAIHNLSSKMIHMSRSGLPREKKNLLVTSQGWKFTLALTVRSCAIPERLKQRSVWQERDAPALEFEFFKPSDYFIQNSEFLILYIRSMMPFEKESLDKEYQRLISKRMFQQALELFPFLEEHVLNLYPDFNQKDWPGLYQFVSLEAIPETLKIYRGKGIGNQTGVDQLFISTGESYPELGDMGASLAALQSIRSLGKKMSTFVDDAFLSALES